MADNIHRLGIYSVVSGGGRSCLYTREVIERQPWLVLKLPSRLSLQLYQQIGSSPAYIEHLTALAEANSIFDRLHHRHSHAGSCRQEEVRSQAGL